MVNLAKYNRHWDKTYKYPYNKKRGCFIRLVEALQKKQIIELIGLRRTGKTTLLFQLINYLIENGVDKNSVLYFTFDDDKLSIEELLKIFTQQTGKDIKKEKLYVFLDEIQKLDNFQNQIKVYYDLYPNIKFIISGSTSLFIKKKTQESLAGRIDEFILKPLDFSEYLFFKEKEAILFKPMLYDQEIQTEFELFLESQFIETININDRQERNYYFNSIMKKIIFEDTPQFFPVDNPEILWKIVKILGVYPGMYVDYGLLSNEIGISSKTLSLYMHYLEESFMVKKLYNFSKNLMTSEKKLKRYYLASPSFSCSFSDFIENRGKLAENYIISVADYVFFWRDPYKHEVDFIDVKDNKITPVEIKYKEKVQDKELNNILIFAKKFNISSVIILSKIQEEYKKSFADIEVTFKSIFKQ